MVARVIRKLSSTFYNYPTVPEDIEPRGKFKNLKVALVTDYFTTECLSVECRIKCLTPQNYREVIQSWKPDLVFVESAFHGVGGSWRYELAKQPRLMRLNKPTAIYRLVEFARSRGVPTVFWNKDDGAFFDAFVDVAKCFDYVFTTDIECVEKYRRHVPESTPVNVLMMPYQPLFHDFSGFNFAHNDACFTGSYYRRILNERRRFLDMVFEASAQAGVLLNVYDRNHDRLSRHFEFRFPNKSHMKVHARVPHRDIGRIYKSHVASVNVNSVTSSETMCSRRLLEILACGGIAVTNPSRSVDKYFRDFCHVASTQEEIRELLARLRFGPSREDLDRAEAGARYVRAEHTWAHRLGEVCEIARI